MHGLGCVTEHEDFAPVCLNRAVLRTAVVGMPDVRQHSITEPLTCRSYYYGSLPTEVNYLM